MKHFFSLFTILFLTAAFFKSCVSVPFEVAGDVIGAGFDVAGEVISVPFEVAGEVLEIPGDIMNSSWEGHGNHRLQHKTTESWNFDAATITQIHAETRNGSIKIAESHDDQIHLEAQINVYSRYKKNALEYAENVILDPTVSNGKLTVNTQNPKPPKNIWIAAHYTIYTPRETNLTLQSSNAIISIDDINGDIYAKTTNGKLTTHNVSGSMQAYTTNGRIELSGFIGEFDVRTTNGSITVNAQEITGNSAVETTNAKVEVKIASGNAPLRIKTTNGSVNLKLPASYSGKLDAKTSNGKVKTEIPVTVYEMDRNELKGDLGGGGSDEIYIRSSNGSINIKKYDQPFSTANR